MRETAPTAEPLVATHNQPHRAMLVPALPVLPLAVAATAAAHTVEAASAAVVVDHTAVVVVVIAKTTPTK